MTESCHCHEPADVFLKPWVCVARASGQVYRMEKQLQKVAAVPSLFVMDVLTSSFQTVYSQLLD